MQRLISLYRLTDTHVKRKMNTAKQGLITEQEYLDGELCSDIKHEFIDGHIYAMTGASDDHNRISVNILSELRQQLKGQPCEPFMADMKLKAADQIFYPDVMVICQSDDADTKQIKHSPTLIVEVLSHSTRRTDVTTKKSAYFSLPSLLEYVVIEQDKCEIQVFRRDDNWASTYYFLGDKIAPVRGVGPAETQFLSAKWQDRRYKLNVDNARNLSFSIFARYCSTIGCLTHGKSTACIKALSCCHQLSSSAKPSVNKFSMSAS